VFTIQLNQSFGIKTKLINNLELETIVELPEFNLKTKVLGHDFVEGITILGQSKL